ncbi:phage integrase family protein [Nocardia terpenica]|uniref:tyrosine-type recombinase/integrase n=1 Tax=Nocardia terpenica TaxID=455432 RepID=UPI002FE3DA0F
MTRSYRRPAIPRRPGEEQAERFVLDIEPAPAPAKPPKPFGDLMRADPDEIRAIARTLWPHLEKQQRWRRDTGLRDLFEHLLEFPGDTWQQRWEASGSDRERTNLPDRLFPDDQKRRFHLIAGIRTAFCMRIIQPSLVGFRANRFGKYPEAFRSLQGDPLLDTYFREVEARTHIPRIHRLTALFDVCCALTCQGIELADLTPSALLHYATESARLGLTVNAKGATTRFAGRLAWEILREMGHFPPSTPPSLRALLYSRPASNEELVDRYGVRNQDIRDLLIAYLDHRRTDADYRSLEGLARMLAGQFWSAIEKINPAQSTLQLDQVTYDQWRESINWLDAKPGTPPRPRKDPHGILIVVRALYADIQTWAVEDPATWARWAAPCPIPRGDLRGHNQRRRRVKERIDNRIRIRQPLLPALVSYVETEYDLARELLARGGAIQVGGTFAFGGSDYERVTIRQDVYDPERILVRLRVIATGELLNVDAREEACFWRWAAVEVLRLSGCRIEELCELSHLSIRQYQRPNGEVIALLVIAPSKTDRERVIPMSAELFHVVAQIIRRLTSGGNPVPLLHRYDPLEHRWTEPMPFLFQRQIGPSRNVVSRGTVLDWLKDICEELGEVNPAFRDMHFTPHDFRRLFASELANSGLPIHIGAALLGHLSIETFRGYVTVCDEDLVRHYQAHLEKRRTLRPPEEYREVTADEWNDFQEHFDKRKVELGGCARPHGTGCQHEFACVRCPMLNINPKMLPRLEEIEQDLLDRRARAEQEAWLGEIEGIDLTLTFLRQKREQTQRLARLTQAGPVPLTLEAPSPRPN